MKTVDLTWFEDSNSYIDAEELLNAVNYGLWVANGCFDSVDVKVICNKKLWNELIKITDPKSGYDTDFGNITFVRSELT